MRLTSSFALQAEELDRVCDRKGDNIQGADDNWEICHGSPVRWREKIRRSLQLVSDWSLRPRKHDLLAAQSDSQ